MNTVEFRPESDPALIISAFPPRRRKYFYTLFSDYLVGVGKGFSAPKLSARCENSERFPIPISVIYAFAGRERAV